jgi:hypothetical protein
MNLLCFGKSKFQNCHSTLALPLFSLFKVLRGSTFGVVSAVVTAALMGKLVAVVFGGQNAGT